MDASLEAAEDRVVLLLDLDCFYAQCERIRLGFTDARDPETCCIALLQWDSVLAVSYPARKYGIRRGDSWQAVHSKSAGQCLAVHVPVLEAKNTTSLEATGNNDNDNDKNLPAAEVGETYESIYQRQTPEEHARLRERDVGRRRYSSEGKACLERYRVASRRIFQVVMKCLGMERTGNSTSCNKGVILEKASIDEFFLDVTRVCQDANHPLWKLIHKEQQQQQQQSSSAQQPPFSLDNHQTVVVGYENPSELELQQQSASVNPMARDFPALERGCQLAHWIRYSVQQQLGFTLSAGISINKMMAKLGAGYGKPNGQALILPCQISHVLQTTKLSKVRNFGGKLGQAVQTMLPPNITEPTLGAVAQHLSLPQLQAHFENHPATAQFVWNAARGHDTEPVQAKNSGNLNKSITAFKSLPRALDADIKDPECLSWINLLAQEVVSRVETDAQDYQRYPRNCTIHYGLFGQVNRAGKLDMKSFRLPFPPRRLSAQDRVAQLVQAIPQKIVQRECSNNGGTPSHGNNNGQPNRKRLRLVRIGVCATELDEMGGGSQQESIASYFAASLPGNPNSTSNSAAKTKTSPKRESCEERSQLTSQEAVESNNEDEDIKLARQLQANYDRENRAYSALDESKAQKSQHPVATAKKQSTSRNNMSSSSNSLPSQTKKEAALDPDLELAKKLQASYDRENLVLGTLDAKHGVSTTHGGRTRSQPPAKKAKTKKISAFFTTSKP